MCEHPLRGAVCATVLAAPAAASDVRVATDAELASALALALPGDSIALAAGSYAPIAITGRGGPGADITLRGEPGATIAGMAILASTRIVVRDLTVAPASATAYVTVTSSSSVAFSGLRVDGGDAGLGATIWIDARCGRRRGAGLDVPALCVSDVHPRVGARTS